MKKFYLKNLLLLTASLLFINWSAIAQTTNENFEQEIAEKKAEIIKILENLKSPGSEIQQKALINEETPKTAIQQTNKPSGDKNTMDDPMQLVFNFAAAGTTIKLPLYGTLNCTVDWGDGSPTENFTTAGLKPHTFASSGNYTVEISGNLSVFGILLTEWDGVTSLIQVVSFGDLGLTALPSAFFNADNLLSLPAILPASITSLEYTFARNDRPSFENLNNWDVSNVTNMRGTFFAATNFNQDISSWDVSAVTTMSELFAHETVYRSIFNQPIGNWDVSNVTDMSYMFSRNNVFNQPICNWNVHNVSNMEQMFLLADEFNQPIGNWDVQNVTNMKYMFGSATKFNQPIGNWDVHNVTNMYGMFIIAEDFNQPIESWNVQNVTNMLGMFELTTFNQPLNNWNVSNVLEMSAMFSFYAKFNQPLDNWDVGNVTNMDDMFYENRYFNQNLGSWDIGSLTTAQRMLEHSAVSIPNYNALLIGWAAQSVQSNINLGAGTTKYSTSASAAHATLTGAPNNWNIVDGGMILNNISWANLSSPGDITITLGQSVNVSGNVWIDGITDQAGQAPDIQAWVGWSIYDTYPDFLPDWIPANYVGDNGTNDVYQATIGAEVFEQLGQTDCYVVMRFQYQGNSMVYGGYNGGFWNGTSNVNGHVQILPNTIPVSNWAFALIGLLVISWVYIRFRR